MISKNFDLVYTPGDSYKRLCYLLTFSDLANDFLYAVKSVGQKDIAEYLGMSQSRLSSLKIMVEIQNRKVQGNSVLVFYIVKKYDETKYYIKYNPSNYKYSNNIADEILSTKDIRLLVGMAEHTFKDLTGLNTIVVDESIEIPALDIDSLMYKLEPYRNDLV